MKAEKKEKIKNKKVFRARDVFSFCNFCCYRARPISLQLCSQFERHLLSQAATIANLCLTINTFSRVFFSLSLVSPCVHCLLVCAVCVCVWTLTNVARYNRWMRQFFEFLLFSRWPAVIMSLPPPPAAAAFRLLPLLAYFITAFFIGVQAFKFKRVHAIIVLSE